MGSEAPANSLASGARPGSTAAKKNLALKNRDEIENAITFGLRFHGRKRVHQGDEFTPRITAERLVRHLEQSGFVIMKKPPASDPNAGG